MTEQTQASRILAAFGGRYALVEIAKVHDRLTADDKPITYNRVRQWDKNGFVPGPDQQRLLDIAKRAGVALRPADFIAHLVPGRREMQSAA